jgi:hypothetical protein
VNSLLLERLLPDVGLKRVRGGGKTNNVVLIFQARMVQVMARSCFRGHLASLSEKGFIGFPNLRIAIIGTVVALYHSPARKFKGYGRAPKVPLK